jgi:hypothetical protein
MKPVRKGKECQGVRLKMSSQEVAQIGNLLDRRILFC